MAIAPQRTARGRELKDQSDVLSETVKGLTFTQETGKPYSQSSTMAEFALGKVIELLPVQEEPNTAVVNGKVCYTGLLDLNDFHSRLDYDWPTDYGPFHDIPLELLAVQEGESLDEQRGGVLVRALVELRNIIDDMELEEQVYQARKDPWTY